ncbi:uncharacterized protein LOC135485061 [Lineus longissimus]|uniref:uncharacterized protein LOC135485061 n=1 Tax=Lineus longissimus TaxID=88925 RepID=UPI002B4FA6FF
MKFRLVLYCVIGIFCLASGARVPDIRKIQTWKLTGCSAERTKAAYQFKTVVHVADFQHRDYEDYRLCQRDETDCITYLSWISRYHGPKGETRRIVSTITLLPPYDPAYRDCKNCILQWRIRNTDGRHSGWKTCNKQGLHHGSRPRRSVIDEVTLAPPIGGHKIDSIDLQFEKTSPPPTVRPKGKAMLVCTAVGRWAGNRHMGNRMKGWCQKNCQAGNCPRNQCRCRMTYPPEPTKPPKPTAGPNGKGILVCTVIGRWSGGYVRGELMRNWCQQNCHKEGICGVRNRYHCTCKMTYPTVPIQPPKPYRCRAVGAWARRKGMDRWCVAHCRRGNCSRAHCSCGTHQATITEPIYLSMMGPWNNHLQGTSGENRDLTT